jgi:hypothetical protein
MKKQQIKSSKDGLIFYLKNAFMNRKKAKATQIRIENYIRKFLL